MIEFVLNNKLIKTTANAGITLVDFIRSEQQLKGTKIGCREGDCGACTVLVGTINAKNNLIYKSITSCISPLGNAHGKHIVTVEGINLNNKLNTIQTALKNNNATQCGFCTPGFVMALVGLSLQEHLVSKQDAITAISGNICRCTGYKSIEKAAYQIFEELTQIPLNNRMNWLITHSFLPEYFLTIFDRLKQIKTPNVASKNSIKVAGGTDLYVRYADNLADADVHLISQMQQKSELTFDENHCTMGANITVSDLFYNPTFKTYFPEIHAHLKLVSSEPIRNMATLAGNIVNASPIGDMTIFLLALNAEITLKNDDNSLRTLMLKDFYKGYKKLDLHTQEHLFKIAFKLPKLGCKFNFEKVSKRTHLDIASVNSALQISVVQHKIQFVHLSFGGVAPIPFYAKNTCNFLSNKMLSVAILKEASQILQDEIQPISDVRGDESYKRLLARQLFYAHFLKLFSKTFKILELVS